MTAERRERPEYRRNPRARISRKLRTRPSNADHGDFEDFPLTMNVSKNGLYFSTKLPNYRVGLRLFVVYPFTYKEDPMKSEYLAEVVRVDKVGEKQFGVAVNLIAAI
jgi:hypothetical protein